MNESLRHYTSNWNDVLASRLQTSCLPNTPQLTSYLSVLFFIVFLPVFGE